VDNIPDRRSTTGKKGKPDRMCKVCRKRKGRQRSYTVCETCLYLVEAENTFDKYGISREPATPAKMKQRVEAYNKLIKAGKTPIQIAKLWGYSTEGLASLMTYARRKGFKALLADKALRQFQEPKPIKIKRVTSNDHGGGRTGVAGCKCEPCVLRRRETRNESQRAIRARLKEQQ
jgi:hypothetical protein